MRVLRHLPLAAVAVVICALAPIPSGVAQPARTIAVTFDDLPVVHDDPRAWEPITERLVGSIVSHRVPAIGFVNENKLVLNGRVDAARAALLERWSRAGLDLGNHGRSHLDLHTAPRADYVRDIARGDSVTRAVLAASGRQPRWFRHPFLHTGRDLETRRHVDSSLAARGYRVAPVTVDNYDYIFAAAYRLTRARGDTAEARRIAATYLEYMERVVEYYERTSVALFGREIPQVLLLHANALNAETFDALARMLLRRGYAFIPLDRAVADSAYASRDEYVGPAGMTWLHRWAITEGRRDAILPGEPTVPEFVERAAR